jgi:hypothetical protein
MIYVINKIYNRRHITEFIILTHIRNLYETTTTIDPILKVGSSKYTWHKWQEYFMRKNKHRQLPCHYFIEQAGEDFDIHVGLPEYAVSYYLEELANFGIIQQRYKNAILVAIGEDFNLENAESRMYEQLVSKLIVPIIVRNRNKMPQDHIKYIDDIMSLEVFNTQLNNKKINYEYREGIHFNYYEINKYIREHLANIRSI